MKRVLVGLFGLLVLGVAVLVPSWRYDVGSAGDGGYEPTRILSYNATYEVDASGTLRVTESILLDVTTYDRHGIFRYFDRADQSAPNLRRDPYDIEVLQDGQPAQVELLEEDQGRFVVAKIGDPNQVLSYGQHTYSITYRVDDVLIPAPGGGSRFYWQVLPGGWAQEIDAFRVNVRLPGKAGEIRCVVGPGTATTPCPTVSGEGTRAVNISAGRIPPFNPVTMQTDLARAVPPLTGERYAWGPQYDPVLGPVPAIVLVVLGALVALLAGLVLTYRVFERTPPFPLQYAPPPGVGPAQAAYVLDERVDREQFVASVLQAAEQGVVDVERSGGGWSIQEVGGWDRVDSVTAGLAGLTSGGRFSATSGGVESGRQLQEQLARFEQDTAAWARREGYVVRGPLGGVGGLLVVVAFGAAIAVALANPFAMSLVAIVPGAFAVAAVGLLMPGSGTTRTRTGRDLWSRVGGFRRVLSTPSSKERFDFSGRQELYTAYLPWAVAFGVASQWAAKYRTETGAEPPVPAYFAGGYAGSDPGGYVTQMVTDFSSTVQSAIGSYQATQSSSSGGGGGFSGGGGGGGGGGGSW